MFRIENIRRALCGCLVLMAAGVVGCETSSHRSERRYDYDSDTGRADREARTEARGRADQMPQGERQQGGKENELNEEYQMVSPGQMVVDPK